MNRAPLLLVIFVGASMLAPAAVQAQVRFELTAPGLNRTSQAALDDRQLRIIDQQGRETLYLRQPNFDSPDGQYAAYLNRAAGQVIRWPVSNRGPMQIGTASAAGYEYRPSQMQVVPLVEPGQRIVGGLGNDPLGLAGAPILPPSGVAAVAGDPQDRSNLMEFFGRVTADQQPQPQVMRLAIRDDRGRDWFLGRSGASRLAMHGAASPNVADWYVVPAGRGYVRVGQQIGQQWLSVTVTDARALTFQPLSQRAGQLWRVMRSTSGTGYWLESAVVPGFALAGAVSGAVNLLPITGGFGQVWLPQPVVVAPGFEPLWRTVNHEIRANPPLPPAQIEIVNSHSEALRILIADRRASGLREIRIEPGSRMVVPFDRDSGATVVETYELRGPSGLWDQQQFVTQIPPAPIYDLSVYEEFLQSIAIDRTGTSPNAIEDVNYQPKSVGWLPLPPGAALPDRGQIDAFQDAKAANNPGAVRRYDPRSLEKQPTGRDPLKAILEDSAPKPPMPRQKF